MCDSCELMDDYYVYPGGDYGEICVNTWDGFMEQFTELVNEWGEGSVNECMESVIPISEYSDTPENNEMVLSFAEELIKLKKLSPDKTTKE